MLWELIRFYLQLWAQFWRPSWQDSRQPDRHHFHRRRYTGAYQKKRRIVKNLWISVGLILLWFPMAALAVTLTLLTTFVSFMILDET